MIIGSLIHHVKKGEQPPWIVPDQLWARIEPLLPVVPRRTDHPGRKRLDDRKVLSGILFVLYTGIRWEFLPQELGFGSGMTCWRRLRDWHQAGVWQRLHELLLAEPHAADALDWSKQVILTDRDPAARSNGQSRLIRNGIAIDAKLTSLAATTRTERLCPATSFRTYSGPRLGQIDHRPGRSRYGIFGSCLGLVAIVANRYAAGVPALASPMTCGIGRSGDWRWTCSTR
jgi:transposase